VAAFTEAPHTVTGGLPLPQSGRPAVGAKCSSALIGLRPVILREVLSQEELMPNTLYTLEQSTFSNGPPSPMEPNYPRLLSRRHPLRDGRLRPRCVAVLPSRRRSGHQRALVGHLLGMFGSQPRRRFRLKRSPCPGIEAPLTADFRFFGLTTLTHRSGARSILHRPSRSL
jgi:hypothetical protein